MTYVDPSPLLGQTLPPLVLRDLMALPAMMTVPVAAAALGLSVDRVRRLVRTRELSGLPGMRAGGARMLVSRSAVIAYLELRYRSAE